MAANTTLQQKMPTPASYTQEEVLRFIMVRDNLSLDGVVSEMRKAQGEKIILSHPYKIFLGKDGRYHTCLKDDSKKDGRRHIAKTTLESLHDAIVEHYKSQEEHNKPEEPTIEILYPKWLEYKKLHTNADSYIYRIMTEWKKYYEGTPIT